MKDSSNSKYKYLKYKLKYNNFLKQKKLKGGFLIESLLVISILLMSFGTTYILYNSTSKSSTSIVADMEAAAPTPTSTSAPTPTSTSAPTTTPALAPTTTPALAPTTTPAPAPTTTPALAPTTTPALAPTPTSAPAPTTTPATVPLPATSTVPVTPTPSAESTIKLNIQKINGDGLCQFYSIIHQLQGKNIKELTKLQDKYTNNYKSFEDTLKTNIIEFIQGIINEKEKNRNNIYNNEFKSEKLANNLKEIMLQFIKEKNNEQMKYCDHLNQHNKEEIITYKEIIEILFGSIEEFNTYYRKETKKWGDDIILTLIAAIFNLKINIYEKRNSTYIKFSTRHPLYFVDKNECENPIEINLLYKNKNHYDSVIKII